MNPPSSPPPLGGAVADSRIKGNLPPAVKQMLDTILHEAMARPSVYGASIGERVTIVEASIVPKPEESTRTEARVVCEVTVTEGPFLSSSPPRLSNPFFFFWEAKNKFFFTIKKDNKNKIK